jgi:uncharacterized lipoprotein YajG
MKKILAAALIAAGTLILAGCHNPAAPAPATTLAPVSTTCVFGATGADVEVQFTDDTTSCATQEQNLAVTGLSWYPISQLTTVGATGPDGETEQNVCILAKDGAVVTVMDGNEELVSYGQQICSGEEQGGWTNS